MTITPSMEVRKVVYFQCEKENCNLVHGKKRLVDGDIIVCDQIKKYY